ncbi:transposase, partial [Paenactinomyces guangxiensis]|nr:transposase [Paenactinomyces guangxiensis]
LKCLVYQVFYRIRSFRELEWKLTQDYWARRSIRLKAIPDHTTLCRRVKQMEESLYAKLYEEILTELKPKTRISFWNSTALRASRYDKDAEKRKATRLGWFFGYKLHAIVSEDLLPLVWDFTPAGFYDNQVPYLVDHLAGHNVFFLLADAAYDDKKLFSACNQIGVHLVTQVNMRNATSPSNFKEFCRRQNWLFVTRGLGKKLLPKRNGIEQLFATLKTVYGLEQPRFYGFYRYYRHVSWVILVYLFNRLVNKKLG